MGLEVIGNLLNASLTHLDKYNNHHLFYTAKLISNNISNTNANRNYQSNPTSSGNDNTENNFNHTIGNSTTNLYVFVNTTVGSINNLSELNNKNSTSVIMNTEIIQATFGILYALIFIIGISGNLLVCYVVFRNKAMQTVTNLFITNLALSDILLCLIAIPFTPLYTFLRRWVFGRLLCHLVPYAQGCSIYISTLTLTSIAMDRYFVIIYPFHQRMKLFTCILLITGIWIIALLVTLPYGLYVNLYYENDPNINYCEEDWPTEEFRKIFSTTTTILQFVLPFLIILICYILVSIRLNDRAKTKPGSKTSKKECADRERKRRTNRMLISMVAVFGLSWLPLNASNIFNDFYETKSDVYTLVFFISHFIAMSSTCYNPFLYAWLNENFRKEFKQVLPCFKQSIIGGRSVTGLYSHTVRTEKLGCNSNNLIVNKDNNDNRITDYNNNDNNNNKDNTAILKKKEAIKTNQRILPWGSTFNDSIIKFTRRSSSNDIILLNDNIKSTMTTSTSISPTVLTKTVQQLQITNTYNRSTNIPSSDVLETPLY